MSAREELLALAKISVLAKDPSEPAYEGRNLWDDAAVFRNWTTCQNRLEEILDIAESALKAAAAGGE